MRQTRPLPERHPEFTVHHWPGFTEYRVENWRLARDGSRRVLRGTSTWSWLDAVILALAATLFQTHVPPTSRLVPVLAATIAVLTLVWVRCTQVLHESLLVFPTLGIQLETHRGHPLLPFNTVTRHFIPCGALEDVIIHEGLRRWNVRFYLAALQRRDGRRASAAACMVLEGATSYPDGDGDGDPSPVSGTIHVVVAFENTLPYFPVLKVVYLGVQETLFPPPTRGVGMDVPGDSGLTPKG
ncbi:hypothetical protein JVU11DRAFT_1025 [Chiua virens]|nr:hypothetical protein JVU11DRAFT_1025 [Chiua virens]